MEIRSASVAVFVLLVLVGAGAWASPQVLVVPAQVPNPAIPHQVHEGAPITLKAMVRDATVGNTYRVCWDVDRDGDFTDEAYQDYTPDSVTHAIWDIGRTLVVPDVDSSRPLYINVRVTDLTSSSQSYASYRLYVHDWSPSTDPMAWTDEQLEVMREMAIQEALWYLHRQMDSFTGYNVSTISGLDASHSVIAANVLHAFATHGHFPAYPPATLNNYGLTISSQWEEENDFRWHRDPYAETAVRMLNYLSPRMSYTTIPSSDEGNTCGYTTGGTPITTSRIAGTADTQGLWFSTTAITDGGRVAATSAALAAFSACLPVLGGTPPQQLASGVPYTYPWEFHVQQLVDGVGYAQHDSGSSSGGWYYTTGSSTTVNMDSTGWAHLALMQAEAYGQPYGVIVTNRHKYRCANNLVNIQFTDGGSRRFTSNALSSFGHTGGALVGAYWMEIPSFSTSDSTVAFPNESTFTRGYLRQIYDQYLSFVCTNWTASNRTDYYSWADGLWRRGDYLCQAPSGIYNVTPAEGNTFAMYWHAMAYRSCQPMQTLVGIHDWSREFTTYLVRAQARNADAGSPWTGYDDCGGVYDSTPWGSYHYTNNFYPIAWNTAMAAQILVSSSEPGPIAVGSVNPSIVNEGCAGGNAGSVTFDHSDSFHLSPTRTMVLFQWDVDDSDGYSWDSGSADYETSDLGETFLHTYMTHGTYTATLRVIDDASPAKADTATFTITVLESANIPPAASAGGPYTIHWGEDLVLDGTADDVNIPCGDTITAAWDLDNDGQYDDAAGEDPTVTWDTLLAGLPIDMPSPISMRVTDGGGLASEAYTQVTIVNDAPSNITATGLAVDSSTANDTLVGSLTAVDTESGPTPFTWAFGAPNSDAGGRFALANASGMDVEVIVADASLIDDSVSEYAISVTVQDGAGESIASPIDFAITVNDNTPPAAVLSLAGTTPTIADAVTFSVEFDESVAGTFDASDVSLASGSLAGSIDVAGSAAEYTVTVTPSDADANGTIGIEIASGAVSDAGGNLYAGGSSPLYTIHNWPGFTAQPSSVNHYVSDTCTFSVAAEYGPIPPSFAWWFDDGAKAAAVVGTDESLTIDPVGLAHGGTYWCEVTYDGTVFTSASATLGVAEHLSISAQPQGEYRTVGQSHTFTVETQGGFAPLSYTWKKDGDVAGSEPAYTIDYVEMDDAGSYTVEIHDAHTDTQVSAEAVLEVDWGLPVAGIGALSALAFILVACAFCTMRRGPAHSV